MDDKAPMICLSILQSVRSNGQRACNRNVDDRYGFLIPRYAQLFHIIIQGPKHVPVRDFWGLRTFSLNVVERTRVAHRLEEIMRNSFSRQNDTSVQQTEWECYTLKTTFGLL